MYTVVHFINLDFSCFNWISVLGNTPVSSLREKMEQNLKRKKEKADNKSKKSKAARRQSENKQSEETEANKSTSLSDSDRKMLERWENMRKQTKPFIHPIRKYMKELHDLKDEVLQEDSKLGVASSQPPLPPGAQLQQQFQFTQFVPQNQNGNVTGLKAVKVPTQAVPVVTQAIQGGCAIAQTGKSDLVFCCCNSDSNLIKAVKGIFLSGD